MLRLGFLHFPDASSGHAKPGEHGKPGCTPGGTTLGSWSSPGFCPGSSRTDALPGWGSPGYQFPGKEGYGRDSRSMEDLKLVK
ncbi:hypothetical protein L6452_09152 [Arctium lappa]|uniref:Uncharacterized protein n=1 Tax=Arctium lappa TaxID=4217 RepID=A0ACB9DJS0_ARCLA|nr:hypothetical protein L6452_09152 [Arctium lappa]